VADEEQAGKILRLGIAALAAITSAFACSRLFGTGGTLVGTGVGAIVSGAAAELYGHVMVRAKHHMRAVPAWSQWNWVWPRWNGRLVAELATGGAIVAAASYGVVWGIETVAGRPLSAVTTGSDQRGSSFTGVTPETPTPVVSTPSEQQPVPPSPSLSVSPSATVSVTPSASVSPSVSPSASSPAGTASPQQQGTPPQQQQQPPQFQGPPTPLNTSSP